MNRYNSTGIINRFDGKRTYKTTFYPVIVESTSDIIVVSNEGDYLDTLAFKYYRDTSLYWIIALANNIGKGRLSIPAGTTLRIPTDTSNILNVYRRLNR